MHSMQVLPLLVALNCFSLTLARYAASPGMTYRSFPSTADSTMSSELLQLLGNSIRMENSAIVRKEESSGSRVRSMPPDTLSTDQREYLATNLPVTLTFEVWSGTDSGEKGSECCGLGQVAGDKGFGCNARFYAEGVRERNRNRAHGRKMSFYGRDRIDGYGEREMRRFEGCSRSRYLADSFRRCCVDASRVRRTETHVDTSIYHLI